MDRTTLWKELTKKTPAELTLIKSLNVLYQKHRKVVLQKNTQVLNEFSCATHCLPVPKVNVQPKLAQRPKVRKTKRQSLLHRQQLHAYEQTTKELNCMQPNIPLAY